MSTLRLCAALMFLVALPVSAAAKAKEKVFDVYPDRAYAAVQRILRDHQLVTFTEDKQPLVSFRKPSTNTSALEGARA